MISTILWIIGGLIILNILFFVVKTFLILLGVKKVLKIVKEEVEAMPGDYRAARKEVQNENATTGESVKGFARKTLDRWYKRM